MSFVEKLKVEKQKIQSDIQNFKISDISQTGESYRITGSLPSIDPEKENINLNTIPENYSKSESTTQNMMIKENMTSFDNHLPTNEELSLLTSRAVTTNGSIVSINQKPMSNTLIFESLLNRVLSFQSNVILETIKYQNMQTESQMQLIKLQRR